MAFKCCYKSLLQVTQQYYLKVIYVLKLIPITISKYGF